YFDVDRILHQLWHALDPQHPWHKGRDVAGRAALEAQVLRWFERLDADIARVIAKAGDDVTVLMMSDHGMGRASRFVVLNNLLLELGYLQLDQDPATRMKAFALRHGLSLRNVHRIVDRLGVAKHAEYKNVYSFDSVLKRMFLSFHNVDWSRSRAYSFGRHYGSLFLNMQGREPHGSVAPADYERTRDEIAEKLLAWRDPELGRPLVSRGMRREEIWHGPRIEEAPDLILLPEDDGDIFYGLSDFGSSRIWDETYRSSGMHRDNGLLVAAGPNVRRPDAASVPAPFPGASIIDLAPTILYLLDQEIPDDMDGQVLTSILDPELVRTRPIRRGAGGSDAGRGPLQEYSAEEEAEVMQRLRDLGYLN